MKEGGSVVRVLKLCMDCCDWIAARPDREILTIFTISDLESKRL